MTDTQREAALQLFSQYTGITVAGVIQRGRDPETARFSLQLPDGQIIHVGNIQILTSRAQLNRVLLVAIGTFALACKPADWENAIGALIAWATTVQDTPDETLEDRVADWLDQYTRGAHTGREAAIAQRAAFIEKDELYLSPEHFLKWIRREYGEAPAANQVRTALADLDFAAIKIHHTPEGARRTTARYVRGPVNVTAPTQTTGSEESPDPNANAPTNGTTPPNGVNEVTAPSGTDPPLQPINKGPD